MQRSMLTALPILLVFLSAVASAEDPAAPPMQEQMQEGKVAGKPGDILVPLAVGNQWTYSNPDDGIISTDTIEGMVRFEDQPWYLLRTYERAIDQADAQPEPVYEMWLTNQDSANCDAYATFDDDTGMLKLEGFSAYYRYPAAEGQTYQPTPDLPTQTIRVLAVDELVKTEAGEFRCIVYQDTNTEDPNYVFTSYVAPGVGIVRYTTEIEGESSTADLIAYTLVD